MFGKPGYTGRFAKKMLTWPDAVAKIQGAPDQPGLYGTVSFYRMLRGTLVVAEIFGLPYTAAPCSGAVYGFHIHAGTSCTGDEADPFRDALGHYDPGGCPHPHHAGDLPPLLGNKGYAWSAFLTDRFTVGEIIGRTVIIHARPDDFTTQPAGNAGARIACGVILET